MTIILVNGNKYEATRAWVNLRTMQLEYINMYNEIMEIDLLQLVAITPE